MIEIDINVALIINGFIDSVGAAGLLSIERHSRDLLSRSGRCGAKSTVHQWERAGSTILFRFIYVSALFQRCSRLRKPFIRKYSKCLTSWPEIPLANWPFVSPLLHLASSYDIHYICIKILPTLSDKFTLIISWIINYVLTYGQLAKHCCTSYITCLRAFSSVLSHKIEIAFTVTIKDLSPDLVKHNWT